jgi:hypothetical protein
VVSNAPEKGYQEGVREVEMVVITRFPNLDELSGSFSDGFLENQIAGHQNSLGNDLLIRSAFDDGVGFKNCIPVRGSGNDFLNRREKGRQGVRSIGGNVEIKDLTLFLAKCLDSLSYLHSTVPNHDRIYPIALGQEFPAVGCIEWFAPEPTLDTGKRRIIVIEKFIAFDKLLDRNVSKLFKSLFSCPVKWNIKNLEQFLVTFVVLFQAQGLQCTCRSRLENRAMEEVRFG